MSTDSLPVIPGDVVAGKYRIERVLGRGGMGFVVEATHLQLDQKVALKFLLPEVAANAEVVGRFVREARAAVKVQSEHVARVLDVGATETGAPFMVMEYLRGADLGQVVTDRGPLPVREAVGYVLEACEAIAEAHALGMVHRDLKPANLFLADRPSGKAVVKVLDFGISKAPMSAGDAALTQPSAMMGSPSYMSPEQMVAAETVDVRTDVWALGVVLYELLTGRLPFLADTMPELVGAVLQRAAEPIAASRSDVPPELQAVVDRCLQKERAARFANVAELAAALAPLGPPRSDQSLERILHVLGLPPGSVRAATVALSAFPGRPHGQTFSPTTSHPAAVARSRSWLWASLVGLAVAGGAVAVFALSRGHSPVEAPRAESTMAPAVAAPSPPPPSTVEPTALVPIAPAVLASSSAIGADVTPPVAPSHPARADHPEKTPSRPAPVAAPSASAGPDCHVVSYFDATGNKHFKRECK